MDHQSAQGETRVEHVYSEGFMVMDCDAGRSMSEDLFSLSGMLNFDGFSESDFPFSFLSCPSLHPMPESSAYLVSPCGFGQARDSVFVDEGVCDDGDPSFRSNSEPQKSVPQLEFSPNFAGENEFSLDSRNSQSDLVEKETSIPIFKSVGNLSFTDRMQKALSLLKESSCGGMLAQVWVPVKQGDDYMLSTSDQPFLLDQALIGYREVSRIFTFSVKDIPGIFHGVPGRVFVSGLPEWTSNVHYYSKSEYLRVEHAVSHEIRGSLVVPIFDPHQSKCCAVLELVTMKEKSNFHVEMENICSALQDVALRTAKGRAHCRNLTERQKSALSEISDVLKAACQAHLLPLALTWIPFKCDSGIIDDSVDGEGTTLWPANQNFKEHMLCVHEPACYVNDSQMKGFLNACTEIFLTKGQGIVGKALQSNYPFFSPDVKVHDSGEYPLAHHARKYGLQAAIAIRLRSTFTGNDDFIVEFFLPVSCKENAEQRLLISSLSVTMQNICRSFRTVSDVCVVDADNVEVISFQSAADVPSQDSKMEFNELVKYGTQKQTEKKRSAAEKNINLNDLQKYFAGSLKDAAKNLGVCPTTLKRICRQHGILRWPSRKIKKVNHSLRKIQTVIKSVQGVEGTLKYDPITGCLVAAIPLESSTIDVQLNKKLELNNIKLSGRTMNILPSKEEVTLLSNGLCTNPQLASTNAENSRTADIQGSSRQPLISEDVYHIDVLRKHGHTSILSASDSSTESTSWNPVLKKISKNESFMSDKTHAYTVKATYKADTVRFKLLPSMDCIRLYEEVRTRFSLSIGAFQLKYMDDEEEWVMLTTDSDLQECIEVLGSIASQNMRLQVRDAPICSN